MNFIERTKLTVSELIHNNEETLVKLMKEEYEDGEGLLCYEYDEYNNFLNSVYESFERVVIGCGKGKRETYPSNIFKEVMMNLTFKDLNKYFRNEQSQYFSFDIFASKYFKREFVIPILKTIAYNNGCIDSVKKIDVKLNATDMYAILELTSYAKNQFGYEERYEDLHDKIEKVINKEF